MPVKEFNKKRVYRVIYWVGFPEDGRWAQSRTFPTEGSARTCLEEVERKGYPGYVKTVHDLEMIGLPDDAPNWWDYNNRRRKNSVG